ncbi:DUF1634 domain-containing protein [Desulfurococcaceae archaeon AG1]|jgi:uncharacterized membrane protein|nr:MAG: hypothetical protein DJ555_04940 [Desulfurococcaceae archaeon]GAY26662.1 DUF1634 domain-containing protein [Desulfurococcaceae archaeon AG1]
MSNPGLAERAVYNILKLSVIASLVVIAIGVVWMFYHLHIQGFPTDKWLTFNGTRISDFVHMISRMDPRGILGLSAIILILGVVLAIVSVLITSLRMRDNSLAIVSTILLILLLISTSIGLVIKSRG